LSKNKGSDLLGGDISQSHIAGVGNSILVKESGNLQEMSLQREREIREAEDRERHERERREQELNAEMDRIKKMENESKREQAR